MMPGPGDPTEPSEPVPRARLVNEPRGWVNQPAPPDDPGRESPLAINPPPFWGRWSRIYLLVAGLLLVEVVVFWWLTRWAS